MSVLLSLSSAVLFATTAGAPAPPTTSAPPATAARAASHGSLPWIEDDYPRAVAEAKRRGVPLFVEAWAPW
jgi:hypothetical protein